MTALPTKGDLDGSSAGFNQGIFKTAIGGMRDFLAGLFGTGGDVPTALSNLKLLDSKSLLNLAPTFAVAGSALTITMKDAAGNALSATNPGLVAQRSSAAGSSVFNLRSVTAGPALTISSGSTLGQTAGYLSPIYIYLIDNAGAQELAVSSSFQGETGIYTTTAEGGAGAADSATVMYSATARAGVPGRLVAIAWSNQAVAGTWAAVPSEVKLPPFLLKEVGEIVDYGGGTVPYGYFLQDGSNYSRTTFAKLFQKYGTTHGVGDGATTFGIGDSRRRVLVGSGGTGTGTLGNAVGNTGGEEDHTLSAAEMPDHTHSYQHGQGNVAGSSASGWGGGTLGNYTTGAAGSGSAHNTIQPSLVVTKMVRWLGDI